MGIAVRRALVAACLAAPLLLTGCGSDDATSGGAIDTDWFTSSTPQDVLAAASAAMADPGSLRLQQEARARDGIVSKDLMIAADGDCTGELQLPAWGEPAELVVQDGNGAFRGSRLFWYRIDVDLGPDRDVALGLQTELADTYGERWTTTPGLETLCEVDDFLRPIAKAATDADLVKDGLGDVEGEPAGRVVSEKGDATVTTWVALAAPHRVLRIAVTQGDGSEGPITIEGDSVTTFSDFGAPVEIDFPPADDILTFELPTPD